MTFLTTQYLNYVLSNIIGTSCSFPQIYMPGETNITILYYQCLNSQVLQSAFLNNNGRNYNSISRAKKRLMTKFYQS